MILETIRAHNEHAYEWLVLLQNLKRSPATVDAYGRGLLQYFSFCKDYNIIAAEATLQDISVYVRWMQGDDAGSHDRSPLANSTIHQRLTAIRLWYDHLLYQGVIETNPVPRSHYLYRQQQYGNPSSPGRGLVRKLITLPVIPPTTEWENILSCISKESLRNRLMFALSYYGALRRNELLGLHIHHFDIAGRLITIDASTSKSGRSRIVHYDSIAGKMLVHYLMQRKQIDSSSGALFLSTSNRNYGQPLSKWQWNKTIAAIAKKANARHFTPHTLRHLRLTHLAKAGWKLHEISSYAGHRHPDTTLVYLHLSGHELSQKIALTVETMDQRLGQVLFPQDEKIA